MPQIEIDDADPEETVVSVQYGPDSPIAFGHVLMGLLRAMADDYGALVLIVYRGAAEGYERINVRLLAETYAEGRAFALGMPS
ncbi:MAG: hypothetical protein AAF686_00890 [Pseudomonadota bacterium]